MTNDPQDTTACVELLVKQSLQHEPMVLKGNDTMSALELRYISYLNVKGKGIFESETYIVYVTSRIQETC